LLKWNGRGTELQAHQNHSISRILPGSETKSSKRATDAFKYLPRIPQTPNSFICRAARYKGNCKSIWMFTQHSAQMVQKVAQE